MSGENVEWSDQNFYEIETTAVCMAISKAALNPICISNFATNLASKNCSVVQLVEALVKNSLELNPHLLNSKICNITPIKMITAFFYS